MPCNSGLGTERTDSLMTKMIKIYLQLELWEPTRRTSDLSDDSHQTSWQSLSLGRIMQVSQDFDSQDGLWEQAQCLQSWIQILAQAHLLQNVAGIPLICLQSKCQAEKRWWLSHEFCTEALMMNSWTRYYCCLLTSFGLALVSCWLAFHHCY